jgi:tyrosine-protein phosphatase SIW14
VRRGHFVRVSPASMPMGKLIHKLLRLITVTLVCVQWSWPQATASVSQPQHQPASRISKPGLANFAEVTPMLYRGGQPHGVGLQSLVHMGINTIIDVRLTGNSKEGAEAKKLGMDFVSLPWHCLFPKDDEIAKFLAYLREHPDKKVFVHCRYGDDRTGMMIAAYRMAVEGWSAADARKEMDAFGFHHVICASLVGYEKNFPERLKKNSAFRTAESAK